MSTDDIKIWTMLVQNAGKYVDVEDIRINTGNSRRQIMSHINMMNNPHIIKEHDGTSYYFMLRATNDEIINDTMSILSKKMSCDIEDIRYLMSRVSTAGYMSIEDISYGTEFSPYQTKCILRSMPNIQATKFDSKKLYFIRTDHHVPKYI